MKSIQLLMKSTQLAIKKGKLMKRNASKQKQEEDRRRKPNPITLTAFATLAVATLEDRGGNAILRSIGGFQLNLYSAK
jgi:hypothetical protein